MSETEPFVLVQLSDPHVGARWSSGATDSGTAWAARDPAAGWEAAIEAVRRLPVPPNAVLVSGDLANGATDAEYATLKSSLARLDAPAYVLPGNHDHRGRLREHFGLAGEPTAPVDYAVDLGAVRLVVLDTTKPGHDGGELEPGQLNWLDAELAASRHPVTLLAMHHPPFATGAPAWDAIGLSPADRAALAAVIGRHPHVRRILAGHVHRAITAELAGRIALTVPSTYVQARLDLGATQLAFADDPAGFAVHAVRGTDVISHIQPVTSRDG